MSEPLTTVATFLEACASDDPERRAAANAMVCDLILEARTHTDEEWSLTGRRVKSCPGWLAPDGLTTPRDAPVPYATAGPGDPDRWRLFGEVWDALEAACDYCSIEVGDDELPRYAVLWRIGAGFGSGDRYGSPAAPTPNAALAASLLLALDKLKETDE